MTDTVRVLAAVIEADGRYLLAQRPRGKRHAGCWEFPGGKVEPGESDLDALSRELREELGVSVTSLGDEICVQRDGESVFRISFVVASISGKPRALEHDAIAWLSPSEMQHFPLAPSDAVCAAALIQR